VLDPILISGVFKTCDQKIKDLGLIQDRPDQERTCIRGRVLVRVGFNVNGTVKIKREKWFGAFMLSHQVGELF